MEPGGPFGFLAQKHVASESLLRECAPGVTVLWPSSTEALLGPQSSGAGTAGTGVGGWGEVQESG